MTPGLPLPLLPPAGSRSILDGAASRSPLDGSGGGLKARFRRSSSGPAAPPEQSATAALAATLGRSPSAPRRPVVPPINLNAAASPQPDAAPAPAAEQQEATVRTKAWRYLGQNTCSDLLNPAVSEPALS